MPEEISKPKNPSILLVEDDELQRQLLHRILRESWDVFQAADVQEADRLLLLNPQITLLLCDYDLPGENGLDFCKRLHARNSGVLAFLVTGFTRVDLLVEAVNSSCLFRFIEKPYSGQKLKDVLQEALEEIARRERALRERIELEVQQTRSLSPRKRISHLFQIIFGVGSFALATLVIVLLVALILGTVVFVLLYILKSALGIDIFADRHLDDFLPFL